MKTVGLKPFVVDDVAAATPVNRAAGTPPGPSSLDGRELLDERIRKWEAERSRFERSRRPRSASVAITSGTTEPTDP